MSDLSLADISLEMITLIETAQAAAESAAAAEPDRLFPLVEPEDITTEAKAEPHPLIVFDCGFKDAYAWAHHMMLAGHTVRPTVTNPETGEIRFDTVINGVAYRWLFVPDPAALAPVPYQLTEAGALDATQALDPVPAPAEVPAA